MNNYLELIESFSHFSKFLRVRYVYAVGEINQFTGVIPDVEQLLELEMRPEKVLNPSEQVPRTQVCCLNELNVLRKTQFSGESEPEC